MEQKFGLEHFCNSEYLKPLHDQLRKLRFFTNSRLTPLDLEDLVEDALNNHISFVRDYLLILYQIPHN